MVLPPIPRARSCGLSGTIAHSTEKDCARLPADRTYRRRYNFLRSMAALGFWVPGRRELEGEQACCNPLHQGREVWKPQWTGTDTRVSDVVVLLLHPVTA